METTAGRRPEGEGMETAEEMLRELGAGQGHAPTMGRLQKVRYSHAALIDLIIARPDLTQNELAAHFGYSPGWISNVLASDAFQVALAARKEEVVDPALKATVEERYRALAIRSLERLQEKLNAPQVSDLTVLRAAELGAKALGIGGHAPPPAPPNSQDRLERLAARLIVLQKGARELSGPGLYEGEAVLVEEG